MSVPNEIVRIAQEYLRNILSSSSSVVSDVLRSAQKLDLVAYEFKLELELSYVASGWFLVLTRGQRDDGGAELWEAVVCKGNDSAILASPGNPDFLFWEDVIPPEEGF